MSSTDVTQDKDFLFFSGFFSLLKCRRCCFFEKTDIWWAAEIEFEFKIEIEIEIDAKFWMWKQKQRARIESNIFSWNFNAKLRQQNAEAFWGRKTPLSPTHSSLSIRHDREKTERVGNREREREEGEKEHFLVSNV